MDIIEVKNAFIDIMMQDFRYTLEDRAFDMPEIYQAEYEALEKGYNDLSISTPLSNKIEDIITKCTKECWHNAHGFIDYINSIGQNGQHRFGECLYLHSQGYGAGFFDYDCPYADVLNKWCDDNWRFMLIEVEYDMVNNVLTGMGV